jgi:hypothetical protein
MGGDGGDPGHGLLRVVGLNDEPRVVRVFEGADVAFCLIRR